MTPATPKGAQKPSELITHPIARHPGLTGQDPRLVAPDHHRGFPGDHGRLEVRHCPLGAQRVDLCCRRVQRPREAQLLQGCLAIRSPAALQCRPGRHGHVSDRLWGGRTDPCGRGEGARQHRETSQSAEGRVVAPQHAPAVTNGHRRTTRCLPSPPTVPVHYGKPWMLGWVAGGLARTLCPPGFEGLKAPELEPPRGVARQAWAECLLLRTDLGQGALASLEARR